MSKAVSRTGEAMEAIRGRISSRALSHGDKLPSIRGLAASLKVSPSTVVEAYDRLVSEGVVLSRPGSGFMFPRASRRRSSTISSRERIGRSTRCGFRASRWMRSRRR